MRSDGDDDQGPKVPGHSKTLSHTVVALGIALTLLIALLQQNNAGAERQLMFDAASARVQQAIMDRVDREVSEFNSGNNFIAATHPGPLQEYQDYYTHEVAALVDEDPGVIFIEVVPTDEVDRLTKRERDLGSPDFAVTLFPNAAEERTILTRLSREVEIYNIPLLGLDVTTLQNQILPPEVDEQDFVMFFVSSDQLATFISPTNQAAVEYGDYVQFLVARVSDRSGRFLGYSIKFQPASYMYVDLNDLDWTDLSMELFVDGIDPPVGGRRSIGAPEYDQSHLRQSREVVTSSLRWRIDVWAGDNFGPSTGLFIDQIWVWLSGFVLTAGAYAATVRRRRQQERLDNAQFELAHARTLAQTDALTGLLNRNGLIDAARQVDPTTPATVFFIDLDGFKSVNDSEGHEQGDQVLRAVALELRSIFRSEDLVSRIGGDEFVVFCEHLNDEHIDSASRRITEAIATIDQRVTSSLGVATRPGQRAVDVKDLMRAADAAMYEAKRSGGNRYTMRHTG